jgi:hypothetical protein
MEKKAKEKGISFDEAIKLTLDEERPGIVAKRRGRAEEVAAAFAFLCSEHASFHHRRLPPGRRWLCHDHGSLRPVCEFTAVRRRCADRTALSA